MKIGKEKWVRKYSECQSVPVCTIIREILRTCSGLVSYTTNGNSSSIPPPLLLLLPTINRGGPYDPVDNDGCDIPPATAAATTNQQEICKIFFKRIGF